MTALARIELARIARRPLPAWPVAWYVVARSADVPRGRVITGAIGDREYVVFRGRDGALGALEAYCPHMGAHLRHASVAGDRLRCPLHHFTIGRDGECRDARSCKRRSAETFAVEERFGLVFLHAGEPTELPGPAEPDRYEWTTATPIELGTHWHAMMVNGFDMQHLHAVHQRVLVEPAEIAASETALRLRYVSRVAPGGGLSDRLMKWVSRDRIRVRQSCFGPIVVVESDLGRARTAAVLGLYQIGDRVRAFGAFGVERGAWFMRLRLLLARWLFTAFLRKDFGVVAGMKLDVDASDDSGVRALAKYLRALPVLDA